VIAFGIADVLVFGLTLHAHFSYHSSGAANSPSVMSVGQLLGWFFTVVLLAAMLAVIAASRQAARYRGDPRNR
jgi:heme/copper-type cytochrome/quinol oxidase subunit 3